MFSLDTQNNMNIEGEIYSISDKTLGRPAATGFARDHFSFCSFEHTSRRTLSKLARFDPLETTQMIFPYKYRGDHCSDEQATERFFLFVCRSANGFLSNPIDSIDAGLYSVRGMRKELLLHPSIVILTELFIFQLATQIRGYPLTNHTN